MSDAADNLARSRLAIVDHIQRRERRHEGAESSRAHERAQDEQDWEQSEHGYGPAGWFASLKHAAGAWWRSHPAHLGLEIATPMLSSYAARKPAQFLGIAAALGAVVMIARPWRVISVTGLVVALVKSSQLSSVVMSAMSAADFKRDHEPPRR
jgi:hypothetical protein